MAQNSQLKIYIEQGFLDEFEKMPREKSYGVKWLWELAEENNNNLFIFDHSILNKNEYTNLTEFTTNFFNGNFKTKEIESLENAHLLFVKGDRRDKIKNSGMIFTLEDFEQRIEEYANIENFINFLESEVSWKDLLYDFSKFPIQNLTLVDYYLFAHEENIKIFDEIPISEVVTIYSNIEKKSKIHEKIKNLKHRTKIRLNKAQAFTIQNNSKYEFNWHDRELVSDYAMVIAGSGFKKNYKSRTNNKLVQFNIFTKDGRRLIKEQKEKFKEFEENIPEVHRVYKV